MAVLFHGFHCTFENKVEQNIEVPLAYGTISAIWTRIFFRIIKSTPPGSLCQLFDDYHDGTGSFNNAGWESYKNPFTDPNTRGCCGRSVNVDIANFRSTLESRLHRCKLRWLLKHVKNSQRSER
ncbi:MAG: hypothetical protein ACLT78_17620 [Escherichia coli]